jgi:hypothetical protein
LLPVNDPANANIENTTQNAWAAVLSEIFPLRENVNGQVVQWRVQREAYRGPPPQQWAVRPDIITLKVTQAQVVQAANLQPAFNRHDHLVVENKAPSHNTAAGWRDLLQETSDRLLSFCANHDIWVICTIGLRYMMFQWLPNYANQPNIALHGRVQGSPQDYVLPSQLRPIQPAPHLPSMNGPVPATRYLIDHTRVMSINPNGANLLSLQAMEQFLLFIRTAVLQNPHPVNH